MPLLRASADHYRQQQRLTAAAVAAARRAWSGMGRDFDRSWQSVGPWLVLLLTAAQVASARQGAEYVPAVLAEQGVTVEPDGRVVAERLAGVASDGWPLDSLLLGAVTSSKVAAGRGLAPADALARGGRWLDMVVQTQVADAARAAAGVGVVARTGVEYVRMLNAPSCARCVVLAGRRYRGLEGFPRHPGCDCRHVPVAEDTGDDLRTDPRRYFDSLSEAEQDRAFTRAGAQAIRDGADISQVVNARRGMDKASGTTREGVTRRRGQPARLMPERIYEQAASREQAVELLRANGYLT